MWVTFAFASALFAGLTAILTKTGVKHVDSTVATALRTVVVLIFAWLMVFWVGSQGGLRTIGPRTLVFLILSGLATGASWLCYNRALQLGSVNQVTPVDKTSTVLTMILAIVILGEGITLLKVVCMALILVGTMLMITQVSGGVRRKGTGWLPFAILSAVFAALTSILGKIGIEHVESNLGTAIRTTVVLIMAWMVVLLGNKTKAVEKVTLHSAAFLTLSGIATGASWLCYYRALQTGPASVVVPIDKLSIVVTILFSRIFLGEKLSGRALGGLILIVAGTLLLLV